MIGKEIYRYDGYAVAHFFRDKVHYKSTHTVWYDLMFSVFENLRSAFIKLYRISVNAEIFFGISSYLVLGISFFVAVITCQGVEAHNDKFGKYDNPVYDTWGDYYKDYFVDIYAFTKSKFDKNEIEAEIMEAVELIKKNFDKIFSVTNNTACLCHGDFWMPNLIIDFWKSELAGAVDPFDMLWAEPEYEIFCLTLGFGEKLKLYDEYKKRNATSKYCDLKVELYALCNELNWYILLGEMGHDYLMFRAKRLIKIMKEMGLSL